MKIKSVFLAVFATFAFYSVSNAGITSAWWHDDGDGAFVCTSTNWSYSDNSLYMQGIQCGNTGHMLGWVNTSDTIDPTLTLGSAVNNDTGGSWIGYQVNVIMSVAFTFTTPGPTVNNPPVNSPNGDWFVASTTAPTVQVGGPYNGMYEGTINYSGGTPVGIGEELDYLYSIQFSGATSYTFTQEIIPMFAPVPEPSTIALLAIGGLGFAIRLRRNSSKGA